MLYGLDIGGSKIEIAVFDKGLNKKWTKRIGTPHDSYVTFLTACADLITEADNKFGCKGEVGIGIPGIIDIKHNKIYTTNIDVAKGKLFVCDLSQRVNRPVIVNNDANCFALSEAYAGEFKQYDNVLGLILGTGIGSGIIFDKKIVLGGNGCAGEIGHMKLPITALSLLGHDIPLLSCGCGQVGCCESYLSGPGFIWLYNYFNQQVLTAPEIIANYYNNDKRAIAHVDRYVELLALYLGNLLMVIDVNLVVIGGGLSNFDVIYQELSKRLPRYLLKMMTVPRIEKARFGDAGGARGAALLLLNRDHKMVVMNH